MSYYVIGDVQGCYEPLMALLDQVNFDESADTVWFAGDLVNRGPNSLETLRFVKQLSNAVAVLGNHDLHLLAVYYGNASQSKGDTLAPILAAADCEELLQWLRRRPLLHQSDDMNAVLIHAGLAPQWTIDQAALLAREIESALQGPEFKRFLAQMYSNNPNVWQDNLQGIERLRFATNCFTRLRYLDESGQLLLRTKGPIDSSPVGAIPWFQAPNRQSIDRTIFFGHWSALGLYQQNNVVGLDTGCVWGESLTAVKLGADGFVEQIYQQKCPN